MNHQYLSINTTLLPNELWLPAPNFEQYYAISNHGRCYSFLRNRLINSAHNISGYLTLDLKRNTIKVHRLVALAFVPNPDNKPFVNHIDGNKLNPRMDNLEWVTHSENMQHASKTGLLSNTRIKIKLTYDDIRAIRARCVNGCRINGQSALAKEYGVSRQTIMGIANAVSHKKVI